MELKWFTRLFVLAFVFLLQSPLLAQDVELTSQAQVNAFTGTKVNGYLLIRGDDITNLSALSNLDTVTHSVFIEYNRKLKVLNGLNKLVFIGGSLIIDRNTELDSIAAFGKVKMIKGPIVLRDNAVLRECCALYPLVSGKQGQVLGGSIVEGNKGCQSTKDLLRNCDADSDNDGVDDSDDLCPNDSLKIKPGACGCGVTELDSDQDGTPDCNDKCPNDPNKIVAGDCGCGNEDKDSDNDGVADCNDECPSNPAITKVGICGCENPLILDLRISNIGACNDKGTPTGSDDTYAANLEIIFEGAPTSGTVLITGAANESISFSPYSTSKSYTLFNVPFKADGQLIEVIATFEGNSKCKKRRVFGIFAPKSCSSGACDPPTNVKIDTDNYTNAALISWSDLGAGTSYELAYRTKGSTDWITKSAKSNQLLITDLLDYTTYEYQIRSYCDDLKYSDYYTGSFTSGGKECKIVQAIVQNINCHNNQTPDDDTDDYFTFDLFVEGSNGSDGYTVANVSGENKGSYEKVSTFRTADGSLGKGDIIINISDNKEATCAMEATVTDPGVCSNDCQINYISIDNILKCWDRGSRWDVRDDFFTADLTVSFNNPPSLGELKLTGKSKGSVSTEQLQGKNSYTFKAVRIPATGKDFSIGATFTNGLCDYSTDFNGVLISKDKLCANQCNIMNAQILNLQCVDNGTANDKSDDYLTFELLVTGVNLGDSYQVTNVAGNHIGTYNQSSFFRTNSGNTKSNISLEITDLYDDNCNYTIDLQNLCSGMQRNNPVGKSNTSLAQNTLTLYPNPAHSELFINYAPTSDKVNLAVYDLLGQRVINHNTVVNRLDISQLDQGLYHLVIKEGDTLVSKKFIKK